MDKTRNSNRTAGGPLDIAEEDVYRNETDAELHGDDMGAPDPDERMNHEAVRAAVRYGRDAYVVGSDVDPDEDNYAPGVREQD